MLKIIFITYSFSSGGAEKQMLWMARTLAGNGVQCILVELKWNAGNQRFARLLENTKDAGVSFSYSRPNETYLGAWLRLRRVIRGKSGAAIWSWGHRADVFALVCGGGRSGCLWISSLRSAHRKRLRKSAWFIRLCSRRVNLYVSNTWLNCELLETVCEGMRSRCRVVYNVVEELSAPPVHLPVRPPRPLRLLMLGNIAPLTKGYDLALDLAEQFRASRTHVEIHVAGRADSGEWLLREIARRDLTSSFFYHGETGDPLGFLRSGHAFLMMSRFEGMPNALLEAASVGLPVISTRVGDLSRIAVDGEHMRLIPIGDVAAAYGAVAAMLDDWPAAVAMGRRGREWCNRHFNGESCSKQLLTIVSELTVGQT